MIPVAIKDAVAIILMFYGILLFFRAIFVKEYMGIVWGLVIVAIGIMLLRTIKYK